MSTADTEIDDDTTDDELEPEQTAPAKPKKRPAKKVEDKPALDADWEYKRLEFFGDDLAYRTPNQNALTVLAVTGQGPNAGKYTDMVLRNHLGPESYERVMDRMINPDETEYDNEVLGKLVRKMVPSASDESE